MADLSLRQVEALWAEAADPDLVLCPKCDDVTEPIGDGKRQCISCYNTIPAKTAAVTVGPTIPSIHSYCDICGDPATKVLENEDGNLYSVSTSCDAHVGEARRRLTSSKTAAVVAYCTCGHDSGSHDAGGFHACHHMSFGGDWCQCEEFEPVPDAVVAKIATDTDDGSVDDDTASKLRQERKKDQKREAWSEGEDTEDSIQYNSAKTAYGYEDPLCENCGRSISQDDGDWRDERGSALCTKMQYHVPVEQKTAAYRPKDSTFGECSYCNHSIYQRPGEDSWYGNSDDDDECQDGGSHEPKPGSTFSPMKTAQTADEIDWTGIEPGSPESASYRPSDRAEMLRMVKREEENQRKREEDRRSKQRDTPDRRQSRRMVQPEDTVDWDEVDWLNYRIGYEDGLWKKDLSGEPDHGSVYLDGYHDGIDSGI